MKVTEVQTECHAQSRKQVKSVQFNKCVEKYRNGRVPNKRPKESKMSCDAEAQTECHALLLIPSAHPPTQARNYESPVMFWSQEAHHQHHDDATVW